MVYVLHGVSGEDGDSGRLSPKMIPECVLKQERQRCVASKEDLHKVHAEEEEITVNYLSFFTTVLVLTTSRRLTCFSAQDTTGLLEI